MTVRAAFVSVCPSCETVVEVGDPDEAGERHLLRHAAFSLACLGSGRRAYSWWARDLLANPWVSPGPVLTDPGSQEKQ